MSGLRALSIVLHRGAEVVRVATLSQFGDVTRLTFDPAYVADPARPTLSLAYRGVGETETQAILRSARDERVVRMDGRLPVFFQNLLPEGHNRARLATARGCDETDELELLAAAGHDLFGAVEARPVDVDAPLDDVKSWHDAMGLAVRATLPVEPPLEDGASLPGVVTKFSAIKDGRRYVVRRSGQPGSFILKLPSTRHPDLVENELTGYRLAASLGLTCAKATRVRRRDVDLPEAVPFEHVLAVERFDRGPAGARIHMEELTQVFGLTPRQKYGAGLEVDVPRILRLLSRLSSEPGADTREFVERLVAFILMGNTDAHLKNWALLYPDGHRPKLAPLYDPVCVAAWFDDVPDADYALNRRIDRALSSLDADALLALCKAADVPRPARLVAHARDVVERAKRVWPRLLRDAPDNVRRSVSARLAGGVALAR